MLKKEDEKVKKTKLFAVVMAAVMTLSMVACGEQTGNDVTPTTAPTATTAPTEAPAEPTTAPVPQNVTIADASITFEDGNYAFMDAYMEHARSANLELSIADFNGSKALKVVNTTGTSKCPFVAIDVTSLFGADVSKIAGVEMVIGTEHDDGNFYAVSGKVYSWWGAEQEEGGLGEWSVYMEKKNPKVVAGKVSAGNELVADAYNILYVSVETDNGNSAGACATMYIDDIRFYDAAGNTMKPADTTVAFNWPDLGGPDMSNLYAVSNAVEFPGFTTSGTGWGQNGFEMPQEIIDALVPGSVVEINFASADNTMWIVMPDATVGWSRIGQGAAYINNSGTVAQIPYEAFEAVLGTDKTTWGARMQCEAQTDWEVYSVKVGTASERVGIANAVAYDGFACSGSGWGQNGAEMPQELIDALVPGSVVKIMYASEDGSMWIVMPDATVGWSRCAQGTAVCDGSVAYVTYEQIAAVCGEDKTQWGARMQFEAQTNWEVYGIEVGTAVKYPVISGLTAFDGFTCSGSGWGQNGAEMPQELIDALVPGSIIEISFASEDNTMWIVMPDAAAGWSRCAQGTAAIADGKAYITYEQIAAVCGEDKSTWGARMQFEAQTNWEVYGIRVGKYPVAAEGGETAAPAVAPDPTVQVADGEVAFTGSKTFADSAWWTQVDLTKADLYGDVDPATINAIKFTCADTNFIVGYNDTLTGAWAQFDTSNTYVIKTADLVKDDPVVCLYLSKGDGVEYTISWEVYTGGSTDVILPEVEEEPAAPALPETVITAEGGKGTVAAADASWWTQIALTKEQLFAGVAQENITGFKFTGDTDFIIAYNEAEGVWIQKDAASSFELPVTGIDLTDEIYYFCFVLSKGDSVVYNLSWEVLTGEAAEAPAAEGVTGTFANAGTYMGNWQVDYIPAEAFAGCENGADVTINFDRESGRTYWNFTCVLKSDNSSKYTDAKYYTEQPGFNDWGFISFTSEVNTYTLHFTAEAVAAFVAEGALGFQTDGIIFNDYVVTPVK